MLTSLEIKNFRLLKNFTVPKLGRVNLIVGKNNSGKSSVLEALQIYAGNAAPWLLDKLASEHGETTLSVESGKTNIGPQNPFDAFFTGRIHSEKNSVFTIGDKDNFIEIEKGYIVEHSDATNNNRNIIKSSQLEYLNIFDFNNLTIKTPSIDFEKVLLFRKGNYRHIIHLYESKSNMALNTSRSNSITCSFIPTQFIAMNELANDWDKIALTDHPEKIKETLRLIEPDILDIAFVNSENGSTNQRTAKVRLKNHSQPIPLKSMGDGMYRILQLLLKTFPAEGGFLLIDEFENGLHYSVQEKVWRLVFELAEQLDIQVFATTHSWDCIESFAKVATEKSGNDGVLFRMGRSARTSDKGEVIATVFDKNRLLNLTQADVEVR